MAHLILVAHGELAHEMKKSAEMIFGAAPHIHAVAFYEGEGLEALTGKITGLLQCVNGKALIFADLFAGTPYNAACAVLMKSSPQEDIEILSGMSLPLVLEAGSLIKREEPFKVAEKLVAAAADTVKMFHQNITEEEEL